MESLTVVSSTFSVYNFSGSYFSSLFFFAFFFFFLQEFRDSISLALKSIS